MRLSGLLGVFLGSFGLVFGCSRPPPSAPTTGLEPAAEHDVAMDAEVDVATDTIPRVVRRLLAEEKDLVTRSVALARELPDPRGRDRALGEAQELADELAAIDVPRSVAASATLDDIVERILRVDTRVALLLEKLRTATNHTSALVVE